MHSHYPRRLVALLFGIFVAHAAALTFSWYWRVPWLDIPMHFLGGVWVAATAVWWFYRSGRPVPIRMQTPQYLAWVALAAVLVVGGLWEVFEFGVNELTPAAHYHPLDTAGDLVFDTLGAVAVIIYAIKKKRFLPITHE